MKYKKTKLLLPINAAYLAGIIDGEGSVVLTRRHKGGNRRAGITITNTEYKMIKWILNKTGVGFVIKKKTYKQHHLTSYAYQIYSQQALDILKQVLPYLQTYKKDRARLILKNYKKLTPRNGKYSKTLLIQRDEFIEKFFKIEPKIFKDVT